MRDKAGSILDVGGVAVGHWTDAEAGTGCTVIVCEPRAVCGVDVRGGAPGTRELALLDPVCAVDGVDAIVLTGGSALGLASASGVASSLRADGKGYETQQGPIPIVPAAVVFDLGVGNSDVWPDERSGAEAYASASFDDLLEGNVGAGAGTTAGTRDSGRFKTGIATIVIRDGVVRVGAIVVPNPVGTIIDETGKAISDLTGTGQRSDRQEDSSGIGEHTVIGVVATNVRLDKAGATKVAQMAHDGIARAVSPAHTMFDGDTLFCLSTATDPARADISKVGHMAAEAVAAAIRRGAAVAEPAHGIPAACGAPPR